MYCSSALVSSMSRVKCVVMASRVAMFASLSCPRVLCMTLTRVFSEDSAVLLYIVFTIS